MKTLFLAAILSSFIALPGVRGDDALDSPLPLKFTSVAGKAIDLKNMRGRVVLIDFWATWCPPCRAEMPNVVATYNKFHDKGFDVLGISLDQDKDEMLAFTKDHGMVWPQYFDGQGWDNEISSGFGVSSIPAMLLIGKDGKIVRPDGSGSLSEQVAKLVNAPTP